MKSRVNRIQLLTITIATLLVISVIVPLLQLSASNQNLSDSELLERKFNALYTSDPEFKKNVDELKNIIAEVEFSDAAWLRFKELFNYVLTKLGIDTLEKLSSKDLTEFRREVERMAANDKLIELEKSYESEAGTRMSDSEEIAIARAFVPRLRQPNIDINSPASNGISKVYVDVFDEYIYGYYLPGKYIIEVSIVWHDEDRPEDDEAYDVLRRIYFGRIQDIETIFIVARKSDMTSKRVSFLKIYFTLINYKGTYSGSQTWYQLPVTHYEAKITSFGKTGQHPKLWVNTWNHLISQSDNNPSMSDHTYYLWNWSLKHGNRLTTENDISIYWYVGPESISQAP